jgi:serine/threonine protein kinase
MIGKTLGPYRVTEKLGEGGMGVVYKAVDTRLDRSVAIKVLPVNSVAQSDRKRRFVQEAKSASALNHPGIVHVYDIGDADGVDFIAMEYVDGTTLHELIGKKGLSVSQAVPVAVQIADALAAAHAAGIVHRDIKPGNIMVSAAGHIKILDFGLAKLTDRQDSDASLLTQTAVPRTEEGVIVGTVAYMSPEQAEGRTVDARSDIFSFGAVLYEMLTGRRAFEGTSSASTLAAILNHDPTPVHELVPGVPRDLVLTIARCLRKDPQRRMQLMADVKLSLEDVGSLTDVASPVPATVPHRRGAVIAAALVASVLVGGVTWWLSRGTTVPSPQFTPFVTEAGLEFRPVWSPDGKTVAYLAEVNGIMQVFTRSPDSTTSVAVTNATANCDSLFWHPDGTRIYYTSGGTLWLAGLAGGEPQRIVDEAVSGAASPDGKTIALIGRGEPWTSLFTLTLADGKPVAYKHAPFPEHFRDGAEAHFSPDGSKIAVTLSLESGGGGFEFWILPFPSGTPKRVLTSLSARAPAVGFDWMPDNRRLVFSAELAGISGRHLYVADTQTGNVLPLTPGTGEEFFPDVSPDGSRVVFVAGGTDVDLIESPLEGGVTRRLLATTRAEQFPSWSPSGNQYVYASDASGAFEIWLRSPADAWARRVVTRTQDGLPVWVTVRHVRFSPDGSRIMYELWGPEHSIWISPIGGGRPVRPGEGDQHGPSWSPDGKQVAYARQAGEAWTLVRTPVGGGSPTVVLPDVASMTTEWFRSPDGEVIAFSNDRGKGVEIVSPDGKNRKMLTQSNSQVFGASRDGSTLYVVRRAGGRWELATIDVHSGTQRKVSPLAIPVAAYVLGFSLSPDGKSFTTSVTDSKSDVWLMEGLN